MGSITALVTAYNREKYIEACLRSLFISADADGIDVLAIVADNGSTDKTRAVAESFGERVEILHYDENMPLALVNRDGIRAALAHEQTDYILMLNDDTELQPGALAKLKAACDAHPNSLLTPLQLGYEEPHNIDDGAYDGVKACRSLIEDALLGRPMKEVYQLGSIVAAAMLGKREVYETIGDIDPLCRFYSLDDDYCNRAKFLGFDLLLVPDAHMLHAHGRFMDKKEEDPGAWWRRWRLKVHGRAYLILKDPAHGLSRNYLRLTGFVIVSCIKYAARFWLKGIAGMLKTYAWAVANYPEIRRTYRRDFDPARRPG